MLESLKSLNPKTQTVTWILCASNDLVYFLTESEDCLACIRAENDSQTRGYDEMSSWSGGLESDTHQNLLREVRQYAATVFWEVGSCSSPKAGPRQITG